MAFQQPTYNILFNAWRSDHSPAIWPPDVAAAKGNLAWGKRVNTMSTGGTGSAGVPVTAMTLLLEATVDLRDQWSTTGSDVVEVPAGSGRFYVVWTCDYIGLGFPNAHKGATLIKTIGFKTPDLP